MRFRNLEAEFRRMGKSVEEVARLLGFEKATLYNRLNSKTNWTLNDMLKVQDFVALSTGSHYTLDYLFKKGD